MTTYAEVIEGIRATIATYTHALDEGRTEDVVATFTSDGIFDMPGMGTWEGHDALRTTYEGWKPRISQRHLVVNTLVTDWTDTDATAVSDVVLVVKGDKGWSVGFVAKYHDTLRNDGDGWKFVRRAVDAA